MIDSTSAPTFTNPDGSQASWIELRPITLRRKAFAWRAFMGILIASALWITQIVNHAFDISRAWAGLVPLVVGIAFGAVAYNKSNVRCYSVHQVVFTPRQRLFRAGRWWAPGGVVLGVVWIWQLTRGEFLYYWWYTWPLLLFFVVGLGLFLLRSESFLTADAARAKSHFATAGQQARSGRSEGAFDRLLETPLVRYPIAVALLYGAYILASEHTKNSGWKAIACVVLALYCARELALWGIGLGIFGLAIWALIAGISAMPVSVAVIVGALIIAAEVRK